MALPFRTRPSFPHSQSLPSGSFHKSLPYPAEGRQNESHNHRKLTKLITWITALSKSKKLWAMPCRATQDGRVMVESSEKMWSTGEENGKPLQYSCLENPMNSRKRQQDRTLKDELPRSVGAQYATGDQWRNNSRKNKETEPKQNNNQLSMWLWWRKVQCCKEQYCIGTWNMLGPWIKANWKWSNKRWQESMLTF